MIEIKSFVNAKEFRSALEKVLKAAPKKSRLAFLLEAHVSFDGDTCTLTCTDLERWCQAVVPAQGGQCSFILKDSRKLLTAFKYFSGDMEFSYQEDEPPKTFPSKTDLDGSLALRCGNRELHQRVISDGIFPELPKLEPEHTYTVDPESLSKRFERIKYAVSSDNSRPCNCCVKFFDNRIGAVDGYRLALNRDKSLCVAEAFYIPATAMKLLPIFEGKACQLSVDQRHAIFENSSVRLLTSIPKDEGLNFDSAIPTDYTEEHTVGIADFADNLRYLNEFILYPTKEAVRFDNGLLSVKTVRGEFSAMLDLSDAPKTVCGFNGGYMLDSLKQFQAKKLYSVTMQTGSSPYAPIILTDQDDLAMILPMRLKNAA